MTERLNESDNNEMNNTEKNNGGVKAAEDIQTAGRTVRRKMTFGEKLGMLWKDKRSFRSRLINALIVAFAFTFTLFIFEPLEMYLANVSFFAFGFNHLLMPILTVGLIIFVSLALLMTLLRGKIHNAVVSAVFGITVAGYVQCNFISIDHGSLDGAEVIWADFKKEALLNVLVWAVILLIPVIVHYFSAKVWKLGVRAVAGLLILVQTVALVSVVYNVYHNQTPNDVSENGYLSRKGIYDVSDKNNVVVFLLDRFDNVYADDQLERDPSVEEKLSGFTFYENFTGSYSRTFPSVVYLLTGVETDYSLKANDYFKKAWGETTFLRDIKNAGYDTQIYTEVTYVLGNATNALGVIDNVELPTHKADGKKILSAMYTLAAYRYMPEGLKPYFHIYTGDISYDYVYGESSGYGIYGTDDALFWQNLRACGLTVDENSRGKFIFYHLQGSHDPFVMDEYGNKATFSGKAEGRYRQTKGDLNIIFDYIDMLKEKGLYDKTTIIITADHGETGTMTELDDVRLLSLFIKEAGSDASAPMKRSHKQLCQDDLRPTILGYFGIDYSSYGKSINDVGEDEERERIFRMSGSNKLKTKRDLNLITYSITGNGNDFANWKIVSNEKMKYPYYDANAK